MSARLRCLGCGHFDNELSDDACSHYGIGHYMAMVDERGVPIKPALRPHADSLDALCSDHRHVWAYFAASALGASVGASNMQGGSKRAAEWADAMTAEWKARFGA